MSEPLNNNRPRREEIPPERRPYAPETDDYTPAPTDLPQERERYVVERESFPRRERIPTDEELYEQEVAQRRFNLLRVEQIIWLVTGILEAMIGIRVLLRLMGANPNAGFAQFVYGMTDIFLAPFAGLFSTPTANGAALEISSLIGMLVYALLAWGIIRVMWIAFENQYTSPPR